LPKAYLVGNLRFGHSRGYLDYETIWEFQEWLSRFPAFYELEPFSELNLELNWQGQVPYPDLPYNIGPLPRPECTEYLQADLNQDCRVDFLDYAEFAADWLNNTII
jgi:hypothetical protein